MSCVQRTPNNSHAPALDYWDVLMRSNVRLLPNGRNSHIPSVLPTHVIGRMSLAANGADNLTESKIRLVTQGARQADSRNVRSEPEFSLHVSLELLLQL